MGEKINFLCRNIPSNVCRYSILKALAPNTPLLQCGLHILTSVQRPDRWEGGETNLTEKPGKHTLAR